MIHRLTLASALAIAGALAGCGTDQTPMWAGQDVSTPLSSASPVASQPPAAPSWAPPSWAPPSLAPPSLAPMASDRSQQQPQRRVGSGAPPDLLRSPADSIRPTPIPPPTAAPSYPSAPASPLDSPGYQRTGPITYGPGGPYNSVGSTVFGPGGKVCTPVGSSLTCL